MVAKLNRAEVYLRPCGFLDGQAANDGVASGHAGLIGQGWAAFSLVEVVAHAPNAGPSQTSRSTHSYQDIKASKDGAIVQALAQIEAPRSDVAGLAMDRVQLMGIVNVTPDSFSDGGAFLASHSAIAHGQEMIKQGASMVDVGGESTRPGAEYVSSQEEIGRVAMVINMLGQTGVPVSIDTRKAEVMAAASEQGASLINDVTALEFDDESLSVAAQSGLPVCLMHSQGTPEVMQDNPQYGDVVLDVYDYLAARIKACVAAGIAREKIVIDPGIGFGKTLDHNLALIDQISMFHGLGVPVLLGASRKSFIDALCGVDEAKDRLAGSVAAALKGVQSGVQFLRVHDVAETKQAVEVWLGHKI